MMYHASINIMTKQALNQYTNAPALTPQADSQVVVAQLADMRDQAAYMKQFRAALGSALDEVKVLRTELALEKSKGFEALQMGRPGQHPDHGLRKRLKDDNGLGSSTSASIAAEKSASEFPSLDLQERTGDLSLVISESEKRLNLVKDAVARRQFLIRDLRKKLQISSSTLVKREHKLEEKIHQGNDLKNHIHEMADERRRLQEEVERLHGELQNEISCREFKDREVKDLLRKMSLMGRDRDELYRRISEEDHELSEIKKSQMRTTSLCYECSWMREYIMRLEHKLEKYRYSSVDGRYRHQRHRELYIDNKAGYATQWGDHLNAPQGHHQPTRYKTNKSETYRRQVAANRQRHQEFRNASLALSPITEEETPPETLKEKTVKGLREGAQPAAGTHDSLREDAVTHETPQPNISKGASERASVFGRSSPSHGCGVGGNQRQAFTSKPKDLAAPYFTVRSGEAPPCKADTSSPRSSPAYLHISLPSFLSKPNPAPTNPLQTTDTQPSVSNLKEIQVALNPQGDSSEQVVVNESSQLHGTPLQRGTLLKHKAVANLVGNKTNKHVCHVRSYPLLSSSPTSSGSVFSTSDDAAARQTSAECSSDSAVLRKRSNKKLVKTRRVKRKPQKYVTFRGHRIDVTRFSMLDFRQIMWSICTDGKSAEEFINFLASEARRLQSDPDWSGRHSLGSPEEWLSLKDSY